MNITIEKLGPIQNCSIQLADFTIICGDNNRGKTYLSYAIYGLYKYLLNEAKIEINRKMIDELLKNGFASMNISTMFEDAKGNITDSSNKYSKQLYNTFSVPKDTMKNARIEALPDKEVIKNIGLEQIRARLGDNYELDIISTNNHESIDVKFRMINDNDYPEAVIRDFITRMIGQAVYKLFIERPFAITSERTGIALFYKDLDINRNSILEYIMNNPNVKPYELITKMTSKYALPIKDNIDFTRDYTEVAKKTSFIFSNNNKHHEFISLWEKFIGGNYINSENGTSYQTNDYSVPIYIASSAIKSLFILDAYIRHVAQENDLLFIDEPELNLNPRRQIELTKLLLQLVDMGIKLFITTHSDYIIREINIAIVNLGTKHKNSNLKKIKSENIIAYFINDYSCIEVIPRDKNGFVFDYMDRIIDEQNERYNKNFYKE